MTELITINIDLEELKKNRLNESFLAMFGSWVETILGAMFGGSTVPVQVKGKKEDIQAFAKTLAGEKKYMESFISNGLNSPLTYRSKWSLDSSIRKFENSTGLKWPVK